MCNIVELLEKQKMGFGRFKKTEICFKNLYGLNEFTSEGLNKCPLFTARFCPMYNYKDVIAVASEDGNVIVKNSSYSLSSPKSLGTYHLVRAHNNAVFDLAWAEGAAQLVTASGDHSAALWDVSGPCVRHVMAFVGHTRSARTVAASPTDSNVFVTGSRDGSVMVWDRRGPREASHLYPDNTISHCHTSNSGGQGKSSKGVESITSVVFTDEHSIATCAAGQGMVCIWDLRRTYRGGKRRPGPRQVFPHPLGHTTKGFSCLAVSPCRLRLYASCINSSIYCFNLGTFSPKPLCEYNGHLMSSFYIKHAVSNCGQYLICGSGDNKAYVWHVGDSKPAAVLSGHTGEVTSAMWAPHMPFRLATASEDGSYSIWSLDPILGTSKPPPSSTCQVMQSSSKPVRRVLSCRFNCKRDIPMIKKRWNVEPVPKSPIKQNSKRPRIEPSFSSPSDFSPTAGLPNYVMDGSSPCIKPRSGSKKYKEEDWLTRLRRETPPGQRGTSHSRRGTTQRTSKAKGSLLNFFCHPPLRGKSAGSLTTLISDNGAQNGDNAVTNRDSASHCCESITQGP